MAGRGTTSRSVYDQVVDCVAVYFGPAAERFVAREVKAHLNKKPESLTREDIPKLHEWSKLAIALVTTDQTDIDEFSKHFLAIAGPSTKKQR
jgi:hypothetical protein